jgi:hypothetical protein
LAKKISLQQREMASKGLFDGISAYILCPYGIFLVAKGC